jgi:hypothetical protein
MTDKELIDAAGRAQGLKIEWHQEMAGEFPCYRADGCCVEWNPLGDDGDNHRLATALDISVIIAPNTVFAASYNNSCVREEFDSQGGVSIRFDKEPSGVAHYLTPEEKPAAVRRAVVLAAATQAPYLPRRRVAV